MGFEGQSLVVKDAVALFGRARITASLVDVSEARFAFHGCDEWSGLMLCKLLSGRQQVIFEIGANSGTETVNLAAVVSSSGRVVSIEPSSELAARIRTRVCKNHLTQVVVVEKAIGQFSGFGSLISGPSTNTGMAYLQDDFVVGSPPCEVVTIDQIASEFGTPDFIWIDIEGHELKALRAGAEGCSPFHLRRDRPGPPVTCRALGGGFCFFSRYSGLYTVGSEPLDAAGSANVGCSKRLVPYELASRAARKAQRCSSHSDEVSCIAVRSQVLLHVIMDSSCIPRVFVS